MSHVDTWLDLALSGPRMLPRYAFALYQICEACRICCMHVCLRAVNRRAYARTGGAKGAAATEAVLQVQASFLPEFERICGDPDLPANGLL